MTTKARGALFRDAEDGTLCAPVEEDGAAVVEQHGEENDGDVTGFSPGVKDEADEQEKDVSVLLRKEEMSRQGEGEKQEKEDGRGENHAACPCPAEPLSSVTFRLRPSALSFGL